MNSRLALGTVQFGLPYGVANASGQVGRSEAEAILQRAAAAGLDTLDTAIAYGESEKVLGEIGVGGWNIISKLPAIPEGCTDVRGWVEASVAGSLARLGVDSIKGLLLHFPKQLLGRDGDVLYAALDELKQKGLVRKIGISIYSPDELEPVLARCRLDMVQAPFNVLDRRLAASGWLARLQQLGMEVHVRSVFLQGLLLMTAANRPSKFDRWRGHWQIWDEWLASSRVAPLQACLGHVLAQPGIDRIVVGVDNAGQLDDILGAGRHAPTALPATLSCEDVDLINPSRWKALH